MHWILRFYSSSLGKKIVMAATGVILLVLLTSKWVEVLVDTSPGCGTIWHLSV